MGIKQLAKVIKEVSIKGIRERPLAYYISKTVAIDASMSIYQFLIAVRSDGSKLGVGDETTSHLVGLFYRTIKMIDMGITPVYIFDGVPPEIKLKELEKRGERRSAADKEYQEIMDLIEKMKEAGKDFEVELTKEEKEKLEMYDKRRTKVTAFHTEECKKLLRLMGVPYDTAPSEAEAYCAHLCKSGKVFGVATEDMDALTFGTPILLRNFTAPSSKRLPVVELNLKVILEDLKMNMDEFIDMCILLGCDYCSSLKGVGPKKARALIEKHRSIEAILENENLEVPEEWNYQEARKAFKNLSDGDTPKGYKVKFDEIDADGLLRFLVDEKGFDSKRVEAGIEKIKAAKGRGRQSNIDAFFSRA